MSDDGRHGPVVLQLPSDPSLARVARLTASSIASLAAMSVDDIDDVKIVVSEVMAALVEHGDDDVVTLKFEVEPGRMQITGYTTARSFKFDEDDIGLSVTVLDAIAETHTIEHRDGELLVAAVYVASNGG